jgi:hypothetical protein
VKTERSKVLGVRFAAIEVAVMVIAMAATLLASAAGPGIANRPLHLNPPMGDAGDWLQCASTGSPARQPTLKLRSLAVEASITWGSFAGDGTSQPTTPSLQAANPEKQRCIRIPESNRRRPGDQEPT